MVTCFLSPFSASVVGAVWCSVSPEALVPWVSRPGSVVSLGKQGGKDREGNMCQTCDT